MSRLCKDDINVLGWRIMALGFALFVWSLQAAGQEQNVRYSLELNRMGVGVRAKAMGNTFVACEAEASHIYWNSANVANLQHRELYFEHRRLFKEIASFTTGMFAMPFPSQVGIGLAYLRYEDLDIPRTDELEREKIDRLLNPDLRPTGDAAGTFRTVQDEILVTLAKEYSFDLPRGVFYALPAPLSIALGSSLKFYRHQIMDYYGLNANMDVGVLVRLGLDINPKTRHIERMVALGFNFQDVLGTPVSWQYSEYRESTQMNFKTGVSFLERKSWTRGHILVGVDVDRQYKRVEHVGVEYCFRDIVAVRGGLDQGYPTVGAGISYHYFRLDYAYCFHALAHTRFQLGFRIAF